VTPPADRTAAPGPEERAVVLLRDRIRRVFRELPGALAGEKEPVHQVRVAGRRLVVALPLLARRADGPRVSRARKVLRRLVRAVGQGRDLDVLVGLLADRLGAAGRTTAEQRALLSRLRTARARARRAVTETVLDLDIDGLRRHLRRLQRQGPADSTTVLARIVAVREAGGAELLRGFSQVGDRYRPAELHALRRHARRLRYAAEVEDALRGEDSRAPALWKRLQDGIGALHDHHLLALWLEEQARAAEARGQASVARAAHRERLHFTREGRRLHALLLEVRPADLALRALEAMARGKRTVTA
jgi:CHAD domain-containing protein